MVDVCRVAVVALVVTCMRQTFIYPQVQRQFVLALAVRVAWNRVQTIQRVSAVTLPALVITLWHPVVAAAAAVISRVRAAAAAAVVQHKELAVALVSLPKVMTAVVVPRAAVAAVEVLTRQEQAAQLPVMAALVKPTALLEHQ